ncbi:MAG: RACo linker region [Eubacteriales bacterium]|nr:RACo linker region [Eubacteriales bacterium]MDN5363739.1 RACo linker region [Eubacteriales bacterium]
MALNPLVKKIKAVLPQPSLADNRPDWSRLRESGGLKELKGDLSLLRSPPEKLRRSNFEINLVLAEEEGLAIREGDLSFPWYLQRSGLGRIDPAVQEGKRE